MYCSTQGNASGVWHATEARGEEKRGNYKIIYMMYKKQ
jgi:hypothetical protein